MIFERSFKDPFYLITETKNKCDNENNRGVKRLSTIRLSDYTYIHTYIHTLM